MNRYTKINILCLTVMTIGSTATLMPSQTAMTLQSSTSSSTTTATQQTEVKISAEEQAKIKVTAHSQGASDSSSVNATSIPPTFEKRMAATKAKQSEHLAKLKNLPKICSFGKYWGLDNEYWVYENVGPETMYIHTNNEHIHTFCYLQENFTKVDHKQTKNYEYWCGTFKDGFLAADGVVLKCFKNLSSGRITCIDTRWTEYCTCQLNELQSTLWLAEYNKRIEAMIHPEESNKVAAEIKPEELAALDAELEEIEKKAVGVY